MILKGKRIVIAIAGGYHEHEFWYPYYRFLEEGAEVVVAGPCEGTVLGEGRNGRDGLPAEVTVTIAQQLRGGALDALYLPGGIWSPLLLRVHPPLLELTRQMMSTRLVVGAICHASWILVSAGVLNGRRISCPQDMEVDAQNAGALVSEEKCVTDGNLVTAEYYAHLPHHMRSVIAAICNHG